MTTWCFLATMSVFLAVAWGQAGSRYKSPYVERYFAHYCKSLACDHNVVCEKEITCHVIWGCRDEPTCVVDRPQRPGVCPTDRPTLRRGSPQCLTDNGCRNPWEICCHGYYNSECRQPLFSSPFAMHF